LDHCQDYVVVTVTDDVAVEVPAGKLLGGCLVSFLMTLPFKASVFFIKEI
jgi:hypothetical protein